MTNRDLYLLVTVTVKKYRGERCPSLAEYLSSLWQIVATSQIRVLTIEQVAVWLEQAFITPPPPFNADWLNIKLDYKEEWQSFADWQNLILYQIADLTRMADAGLLDDDEKYFGIDSPSGSRWYNFDPFTYLECGVRGSLGGYEEDEVIVTIPPPAGESADSPVYELPTFTWAEFISLLQCGQYYE